MLPGAEITATQTDTGIARNTVSDETGAVQFGGTFGGPIIRNKLFFFGGYQGTTTRQDPSSTRTFVPTKEMLAGDFTTF